MPSTTAGVASRATLRAVAGPSTYGRCDPRRAARRVHGKGSQGVFEPLQAAAIMSEGAGCVLPIH